MVGSVNLVLGKAMDGLGRDGLAREELGKR